MRVFALRRMRAHRSQMRRPFRSRRHRKVIPMRCRDAMRGWPGSASPTAARAGGDARNEKYFRCCWAGVRFRGGSPSRAEQPIDRPAARAHSADGIAFRLRRDSLKALVYGGLVQLNSDMDAWMARRLNIHIWQFQGPSERPCEGAFEAFRGGFELLVSYQKFVDTRTRQE